MRVLSGRRDHDASARLIGRNPEVQPVAREAVKLTDGLLPMPQPENGFETVASKRMFKTDTEIPVAACTDGVNQSLVILERPELARNDVVPY
ncbi:MAG: hypothetical protein ACREQT_15455 [Candidatus Binataceae bacterium]